VRKPRKIQAHVRIWADNGGYSWCAIDQGNKRQLAEGWLKGSKANAREAARRAIVEVVATLEASGYEITYGK
jgi:hypothetical protein